MRRPCGCHDLTATPTAPAEHHPCPEHADDIDAPWGRCPECGEPSAPGSIPLRTCNACRLDGRYYCGDCGGVFARHASGGYVRVVERSAITGEERNVFRCWECARKKFARDAELGYLVRNRRTA